jgi:glutamine---fructose-6-phosphate transaminase (isomerizing)
MCGIFGITITAGAKISRGEVKRLLETLYRLSESRGKESAGLHITLPESREAFIVKSALPASRLLKSTQYQQTVEYALKNLFTSDDQQTTRPIVAIAHSRLVTNGSAARPENNQPVHWGKATIIHNGIIVNVDDLWTRRPELVRTAEVDTEVLAAMLSSSMDESLNPTLATCRAYAALKGAASIAWTHAETSHLTLATNTGDLYFAQIQNDCVTVFASEKYILAKALEGKATADQLNLLKPGKALTIDVLSKQRPFEFDVFDKAPPLQTLERMNTSSFRELSAETLKAPKPIQKSIDETLLRYNQKTMREIRRCSSCVLPETFPFINFNDNGVCNYCVGYRPKYKGRTFEASKTDFLSSIENYRSKTGAPDVLVPFSGGRDSCYGLHLIKREFGFNPITFTYDWGMVTDLARRNIARLCGELGVPNILVSADIKEKRENVRKNVSAWLSKPDLGMVPLFMAGDKHFFKIVNDLKRQTGISLDLWSANPLENTDFKSGFCGISPDFDKTRLDYLSLGRKLKMGGYYASRFVMNPGYINTSLVDTGRAFVSYYLEPRRDFFFMFNDIVWNEDVVNQTIIDEYDFEISPDSPSTWRIGDGTAPFYNYIYMTARGFTEFDTFRSNQIREGQIDRASALEAILSENRPRVESLRWYLETINIDFNDAIRTINKLDTMALHR